MASKRTRYEDVRRAFRDLKNLSFADAREQKVTERYWELLDLMGYLPEDLRRKAWILGMEKGW